VIDRDPRGPGGIERILGEMRSVRIEVDVTRRVMESVRGIVLRPRSLPSTRQLGWSAVIAIAALCGAAAGLLGALSGAPAGTRDALLVSLRSAAAAAGALGRAAVEFLGPLAAAIMDRIIALASPFSAGGVASGWLAALAACAVLTLAAALLLAGALLWNDIRREPRDLIRRTV
jgi:hypothetical protein